MYFNLKNCTLTFKANFPLRTLDVGPVHRFGKEELLISSAARAWRFDNSEFEVSVFKTRVCVLDKGTLHC